MYNNIPLINLEEKSDEIENARNDLVRKFEWLPHCNMLPFVFGIAISIKRFQIYLMTPDNKWKAKQPIVNVNIEEIVDRTQCLLYAVNVARVLKLFIQSDCLQPSRIKFKIWIERPSKWIRLFPSYVENRYEEKPKYLAMKKLYSLLKKLKITHIELPDPTKPFDDEECTIRLSPVGVERRPKSIDELCTAMRHVLICIRSLHKKAGYLHCDLRWPNIILVGSEWYVIDYTESIANNASLKDRLAVSSRIIEENNFDSALPWSMRHDYYQLGMLIRNCHLDDVPN